MLKISHNSLEMNHHNNDNISMGDTHGTNITYDKLHAQNFKCKSFHHQKSHVRQVLLSTTSTIIYYPIRKIASITSLHVVGIIKMLACIALTHYRKLNCSFYHPNAHIMNEMLWDGMRNGRNYWKMTHHTYNNPKAIHWIGDTLIR